MRRTLIVLLFLPKAAFGQPDAADSLSVCSFNVQFLGNSTTRDNAGLASILAPFDIVVIQELVAPPIDGEFPDETPFNPDAESAAFFDAMGEEGFTFVLSEEDTGKSDTNHKNNSATEWYVAFFKEDRVTAAADLPAGFLANDRTAHPDYDRVPYAFAFRDATEKIDFVLISVHLRPNAREAERRKHELATIGKWVRQNDDDEKDFIIIGDMNIEDEAELKDALPRGFRSLNDECRPTNTNISKPKPYDHAMFRSRSTTKHEIDRDFDFRVFNLIEAMRPFWDDPATYPGGAVNPIESPQYDHDEFRAVYSDHHPVVVRMLIPESDDDG